MPVQALIVVGGNVAPGKRLFQMAEELRVDRHHIFEVAMRGAVLHHQDSAVALDDLRLDLADFLVEQDFVRQFSVEDLTADFRDTLWAKRIGGARPPQRRLGFLVRLEKRLVAPPGSERLTGMNAVHPFKNEPRSLWLRG